MNGNFRRNLIISSSASLAILIISSAASFISIRSLLNTNEQVNHTQLVIYSLNDCAASLTDAQTSMRGYLISGNGMAISEMESAVENANAQMDRLEYYTRDNGAQQVSIRSLRSVAIEFYKYLEIRTADKKRGNPVMASDLDRGRDLMRQMRSTLSQMEKREQALLAARNDTASRYGRYSSVLIVVASLLAMLISAIFSIRILRDYRERLKLQLELQERDADTAERIRVIGDIAGQIAKGNFDTRVTDSQSDALGGVAESLNDMAGALGENFTEITQNRWLQTGIAELNNVMIGEKPTATLASDVIRFLAEYTDSKAGVLYLLEDGQLHLAGSFSYKAKSGKGVKPGEGLSGQALASNKLMELREVSAEDISISYAMGEIRPKHVIAFPLNDTGVTGVVELASLKIYSEKELEFFRSVSNNIGIALRASENRKRVQELLEETQAQAEELKTQHGELEGMNAELETQTEKLQASEEELKVQQEELQQINEELAERSVLLEEQNTEIQRKSEALEISTRYKSEFLANMSHELRTPLNSILLLSRLLSENDGRNMTGEQVEFARVIQSSGNGLLALIDEILDLSKIEAGKMELEILDVTVAEVTETMKNLFGEVARDKGITFKVDTKKAPLVMKTDKMRLEQILKNLISNAIKFTSEGSVTLSVRKNDKSDKLVDFAVTDTGIGIPPQQQPLVFEAFRQADGSTKRKYCGTGLGLSISRELARLLKGEISLQSQENSGSTFTLTVPVSMSGIGQLVVEKAEVAPVAETSQPKENPYISTVIPDDVPDDRDTIADGDKVILIVEDDVNFAKSLLEFTRKRKYKGVVTVRGDQALNLALLYRPTGVLLDIQLPVKSGWEVMEELKKNPETKHIPVHVMSSHKLRQESLLKGAVNFLEKPVAFEQIPEVFQRIEQIVNRESQKVLIIEDNSKHARALAYFLETHRINSEIRSDIAQGIEALQKDAVNCVILDMGIPDKQAYEILESIKRDAGLENLPVIVFTGKSLSMSEESKIKQYADSIVVKTAHSYQRMLDEVSLFLHLVEDHKKNSARKDAKALPMNNVLRGKTVLIVDDDVRNIYSLTKALEILQMKVVTAIDGNEALKALEANPQVDVVLLDMMMPNMDGYETARKIRENASWKSLPVIAVTAKAMTGDREKCIGAGASDYITKPVDVDQLLSLLRVWLYDKN